MRLDSNSGGDVYILSANSGQNQQWNWNSDGTIVDVATGRCLDSSGYYVTVFTRPCNGGDYQVSS